MQKVACRIFMKKIAMLTIHHTTNFGSALQTFALYEMIKRMGYDVELIDYRCEAIENREFFGIHKLNLKTIYRQIRYGKRIRDKENDFNSFVASYAKMSPAYTKETISSIGNKYDTYLVGSDIVWGLNVTGNDFTYFLDFVADEKKKIAFASSAGLKWPKEYESKISSLLKRFNYIGVRESIVADWIEELTDSRPDEVVDPTMLWRIDFWDEIANKSTLNKKNYVLIYFSDKEGKIFQDAIRYGRDNDKKVYYINYGKKIEGLESIQPTKIEDFLYLIKNADMVFSASFHGLLFSLYYNKEVYFYNRANFSRMISLAKWLEIEDHDGMSNPIEEENKIDYGVVNLKIQEMRNKSIAKLAGYIGGAE